LSQIRPNQESALIFSKLSTIILRSLVNLTPYRVLITFVIINPDFINDRKKFVRSVVNISYRQLLEADVTQCQKLLRVKTS
jgi:hypothetical protein